MKKPSELKCLKDDGFVFSGEMRAICLCTKAHTDIRTFELYAGVSERGTQVLEARCPECQNVMKYGREW